MGLPNSIIVKAYFKGSGWNAQCCFCWSWTQVSSMLQFCQTARLSKLKISFLWRGGGGGRQEEYCLSLHTVPTTFMLLSSSLCQSRGSRKAATDASSPTWSPAPAFLGTSAKPSRGLGWKWVLQSDQHCQSAIPATNHSGQRETQNARTLYFPPPGKGLFVPKTHDKLITDCFNSNQLVKKRKWRKRFN